MELDEAIKRLNTAGFIVEGTMSMKDKIDNAKRFNASLSPEEVMEWVAKKTGSPTAHAGERASIEAIVLFNENHIELPFLFDGDICSQIVVEEDTITFLYAPGAGSKWHVAAECPNSLAGLREGWIKLLKKRRVNPEDIEAMS